MILVDTSIWIDHLHRSEATLSALLNDAQVCTHPLIIGELALGSLRDRQTILELLSDLPSYAVGNSCRSAFVRRGATPCTASD